MQKLIRGLAVLLVLLAIVVCARDRVVDDVIEIASLDGAMTSNYCGK